MRSGSSQESAALAARLRAGDTAALGPLYVQYSVEVHRVGILFLGSEVDAEDLVHDVFAGLQRALDTYEERGVFGPWLRRVAVRTALMKLRAVKREREVFRKRLWELRTHEPPPEVDKQMDLEAALASLPERLRIVFVLKEVEGMRHEEIGRILGITVAASKVRLFRAREILRTYLES